jgi:hypothetical protein
MNICIYICIGCILSIDIYSVCMTNWSIEEEAWSMTIVCTSSIQYCPHTFRHKTVEFDQPKVEESNGLFQHVSTNPKTTNLSSGKNTKNYGKLVIYSWFTRFTHQRWWCCITREANWSLKLCSKRIPSLPCSVHVYICHDLLATIATCRSKIANKHLLPSFHSWSTLQSVASAAAESVWSHGPTCSRASSPQLRGGNQHSMKQVLAVSTNLS